jgi:hypothetical protein
VATVRNLSASALSVPAFDGRAVDPGETVDTDNATAAGFLDQPDWQVELDDTDGRTVGELRADLEARGLPTGGRKSELIERLAHAGPVPDGPPSAGEQMATQNDEQGE